MVCVRVCVHACVDVYVWCVCVGVRMCVWCVYGACACVRVCAASCDRYWLLWKKQPVAVMTSDGVCVLPFIGIDMYRNIFTLFVS